MSASEIVMPRLSDSMEEGTILKWLRADGDDIRRGEELVEIETDKATMTYEADADGVLEIVAHEGDTLPIGAVIARLGAPGSTNGAPAAPPTAEHPEVAPVVREPAPPRAQPAPPRATPPPPQPAGPPPGRAKASPLARRMARELGVDLAAVRGSGPGGRIVRADVEGAGSRPAPAAAPAVPVAQPADVETAKGRTTTIELTRTQQAIARRMASAKATVPEFTLSAEIDMERCVELRERLRALAGEEEAAPSLNDMIVRAAALALREHPRANGAYRDGRFELYSRVNVGIAVATADGLVVPTVFDADEKALGQIAAESRALAARVRAGTITPPELSGGTFTVSNLGMFGVDAFTAIINPPQAAILSVGAVAQRAVVRDGALVARNTMTATLACDHRILYGADAAEFLGAIRRLLDEPLALVV